MESCGCTDHCADVLMVWHTFMLNPRYYLEDCMRLGLDNVWATGMPWSTIDKTINPEFNYVVSEECKADFAKHCAGHAWENEKDEMFKFVKCPKCHTTCRVRWTTCDFDGSHWSPGRCKLPSIAKIKLTHCTRSAMAEWRGIWRQGFGG